jgi:CDP-4-dehydro-6-deoxyglucose reductase, E1
VTTADADRSPSESDAPELRNSRDVRDEILGLVAEYQAAIERERTPFVPGRSPVQYAGRVYGTEEVTNLVASSLQFWLTEGRYSAMLEKALQRFLGREFCRLVNSGSSANLVAFSALTSPRLGERRINPGDEVITLAAGFPTTVAPIIQNRAVPVFLDIDARTANVNTAELEGAISDRTRAVFFAHTLGNPFDLDAVRKLCRNHNLWLIEDNCDALGSRYTSTLDGEADERLTGTFGDLATSSFYPPHHMTTGEGGAVYTDNEDLDTLIASFRDWGRDCYCRSGKDNTCGIRFEHQLGSLPFGYDHKYTYSHFGYNLKMTDMQASVGLAQVARLETFGAARRAHHAYLRTALKGLEDALHFIEPTERADPSWFGFLMVVKPDAPFGRAEIVSHLEAKRIQTRMLFAGNILRHPAFDELHNQPGSYRLASDLKVTDDFMENAFWIGVYPGMTEEMLEYMSTEIRNFCASRGVGT